jgi:hypothetical protein
VAHRRAERQLLSCGEACQPGRGQFDQLAPRERRVDFPRADDPGEPALDEVIASPPGLGHRGVERRVQPIARQEWVMTDQIE